MSEVLDAVNQTLNRLELKAEDQALAALARNLATRIDSERSGRTAAELAAKLTTVLQTLREEFKAKEVPDDSGLAKFRNLHPVREA